MAVLCVLAACSAPQEVATVGLDLSACLVPSSGAGAGCGDGLRARFAAEPGIPACLAIESSTGAVAIPLVVSPSDGALSAVGGGAPTLPLQGTADTVRLKLFVLDRYEPALCQPDTFSPRRSCDARLPRCLLATQAIDVDVSVGTTTPISFGGADHPCLVECNDSCRPGDPLCTSVCTRTSSTATEPCDGVDNDCDSEIDEGCDRDDDGFCAEGVPVVGGEAARCPELPRDCEDDDDTRFPGADEACDGIDNDCDGQTDEPQDLADEAPLCEGTEAKGVCATSRKRCEAGRWLECDFGDRGTRYDGQREERCGDGFDNDCDGRVDIGDDDCLCGAAGDTRPCGLEVGECERGTQECTDSAGILLWGPCDGTVRIDEECNGLDDDCDGRADEDLVSSESLCPELGVCAGRPTVCRAGDWRCGHPPTWEASEASCDGLDNDCDGETDETLSPGPDTDVCPVLGVCAGGAAVPVCVAGTWICEYPPTDHEPEEVSCDGKDNDCDGQADEGCPCAPDARLACGTDVGACEQGVQRCENGTWGPCRGAVHPGTETCNGLDDDCDGAADEGLVPPADARCPERGVCAGGPSVCREGVWACVAEGRQPVETTCDGQDNDCDGVTDEPDDLTPPAQRVCPEAGVCAGADAACLDGQMACAWPKTYEPEERTCDGLDNDCDGQADEGELDPPDASPCPPATGVCVGAEAACAEGGWACHVPAGWEPEEATCDSLDNDCDGETDVRPEGGLLSEPCYGGPPETRGVGMCQEGEFLCRDGAYDRNECAGETLPGVEVCNGLDDDCDDETDELPEVTCGLGVCGEVLPGCTAGQPTSCAGRGHPENAVAEECDDRDNDCDGLTDEDAQGEPLGGRCYTGAAETEGVGACHGGRLPCDGAQHPPGTCLDQVLPTAEACNGVDDDCDGETDEADGGGPLVAPCYTGAAGTEGIGACHGGTRTCRDGAFPPGECEDEVVPSEETCNGQDDDCDGATDLDPLGGDLVVACFDGPAEAIGVGPCVAGRSTCAGGVPGPCLGHVAPAEELCDAIDNDCDGTTDDGPPTAALQAGPGLGSAVLAGGLELGLGDFTVEAWVRPDPAGVGLFGHVLDQTGPGGLPRLSLYVTGAGLGGTAALAVYAADGTLTLAAGVLELNEGWHHLAGVRQGRVLRLYVDGVLDGREVIPSFVDLGRGEATLAVGRRTEEGDGAIEPFAGLIDEVRASRGARYRARFSPRERLDADVWTAELWHLDEGAGATASSETPHGRWLSLTGDAWAGDGMPVRFPFYRDADLDGAGDPAQARRLCVGVEGWTRTPGDCDDEDGLVGLPEPEVSGNQIDDDCDGRTDAEDGAFAVALDGASVHMRTSGNGVFKLQGTSFTWDVWLWLAAQSPGQVAPIVSNRLHLASGGVGYLLGIGGLAAGGETAGRPVFLVDDGEQGLRLVGERTVPLGRWVHLGLTFEPQQRLAVLWLDGQEAGTGVLVPMPPTASSIVSIGGDDASPGDLLHGWLDDLRLSSVRRWIEAFEPPVCPLRDGSTTTLWRFETEQDGASRSEGLHTIPAALGDAVLVPAACEDREPPLSDCRSSYPTAQAVCEDTPVVCALAAPLAGDVCDAWCDRAGLLCLGAQALEVPPCGAGEALAAGCQAAAEEALCVCER